METSPTGGWPIRRRDPEEPGQSWGRGQSPKRAVWPLASLPWTPSQVARAQPRRGVDGSPGPRRSGPRECESPAAGAVGGRDGTRAPEGLGWTLPPVVWGRHAQRTQGCGTGAARSREHLVDPRKHVPRLRGREVATGRGPAPEVRTCLPVMAPELWPGVPQGISGRSPVAD